MMQSSKKTAATPPAIRYGSVRSGPFYLYANLGVFCGAARAASAGAPFVSTDVGHRGRRSIETYHVVFMKGTRASNDSVILCRRNKKARQDSIDRGAEDLASTQRPKDRLHL